jgi:hypothetical protein
MSRGLFSAFFSAGVQERPGGASVRTRQPSR